MTTHGKWCPRCRSLKHPACFTARNGDASRGDRKSYCKDCARSYRVAWIRSQRRAHPEITTGAIVGGSHR